MSIIANPEPRKAAGRTLTLILAILVSAVAPIAMADEAHDAYKEGQSLLKEHKTLAALRSFEKAVSLKPDSVRYQDALEKAKDQALTEALQHAPQFAASDFTALVKLHEICKQINPNDPRTLGVEKILSQIRYGIEARIAQAKDKAISGDFTGARSLLEPLHRYREFFSSLSQAEAEIEFRSHLQAARESTEKGNYKLALEEIQKASSLRPESPDITAIQAWVAEGLVAKLRPLVTERAASGRLGDLGFAVYAIDEVERLCPLCKGRIGDAEKLRTDYQKGALALLNEMSKVKSRPAGWAMCGAVAEARLSFNTAHKAALDAYCAPAAESSGLRVGLAIKGPENCLTAGLASYVQSLLPAGTTVTLVTTANGASVQDLDLSIFVNIDRCTVQSLGDAGVRVQTSSYVAGTQQLANPEYTQIESQLRIAQVDQARFQQAASANPNDFSASLGAAAAAIRVGTLSNKLRKTSPYIERPVEAPYQYEQFQTGATGLVEGSLDFSDTTDTRFSRSIPLHVSHEVWAAGVRGIYPSDTRGLRNQEPAVPGPQVLQEAARKDLDAQIGKGLGEVVPVWLAAKASAALASRRPFDSLGYLTILRIAKVSESDPDLLRFKEKNLASQLLTSPEIEAHRQALSLFEARMKSAAETTAAASGSGRLQFLGDALKAVVSVRRGDRGGTGFLVSPSGLVVTNYHVVEGAGKIEVETGEGELFLATIVNQSPEKDLALLRIPASKLPFLRLGSSQDTEIGEDIYALGNPRGLQGTVTKGIISAKRRLGDTWLVQIDAPINPGNSGGPLLLSDGRVVGVNTLKLTDSEGLNFAVSIDEVKTAFAAMLDR
jgi:S1-C subfamily serine protease